MNKSILVLVLLCAAAPGLLRGADPQLAAPAEIATKPAASVSSLFTNSVAKGKGVSVTQGELDDEYQRVKIIFAQQGKTPPPEGQVLQGIIMKQLLLAKATDADRAKAKESFETSLKKFKEAQKMTDDEFDKSLSKDLMISGLTRAQWEKQNTEQLMLPLIIEREVKVTVTEDEAKAFYDENSAAFEHPETIRVGHILFATRDPNTREELSDENKAAKKKLAEDVLKRARAGEDFAALAKQYSDDPSAKDNGGELKIAPGMLQNLPQLETAMFALKTNEVSDLIPVPYGYHIAKLYEKTPAKKEPYAGLDTKTVFTRATGEQATLRELLADQARQKQMKGYMQQLEKEADVQILDADLKLPEAPETDAAKPAEAPAATTAPVAKEPAKK